MRGGWGPFQFPLLPEQASELAVEYDRLFWTISILTIVFTALVGALVLFLAIRYRKSAVVNRKGQIHHHTGLELTWTGIPLVLAMVIFVWSAKHFIDQRTMPEDAVEIYCIGKQWMWHFEHMDGIRENNELHVPVGKPIKLTMISQDVIHAMYLPEMRAQYMVVPGRYTNLHFTPTKPGKYRILCTMHCGTQHSEMVGQLVVLSQKDYADWKENNSNRYEGVAKTMPEAGRKLWTSEGCDNCHTGVDNSRAPSVVGLFGKEITLDDGSKVTANEDYIRESILHPHRKITAGYINTMQVYDNQLTEKEVLQLIEFIKSGSVGTGDYERPEFPEEGTRFDGNNPIDRANEGVSAGNSQFDSVGEN